MSAGFEAALDGVLNSDECLLVGASTHDMPICHDGELSPRCSCDSRSKYGNLLLLLTLPTTLCFVCSESVHASAYMVPAELAMMLNLLAPGTADKGQPGLGVFAAALSCWLGCCAALYAHHQSFNLHVTCSM